MDCEASDGTFRRFFLSDEQLSFGPNSVQTSRKSKYADEEYYYTATWYDKICHFKRFLALVHSIQKRIAWVAGR